MTLKKLNWRTLSLLVLLMILGIFIIYSASSQKLEDGFRTQNFYLKQIFWAAISLILVFVVFALPKHILDMTILPLYIFTIVFLVLVLFQPEVKGSHRWINMGFFNFQPSELAKLITILMISRTIAKPNLTEIQILVRSLAVVILPVILIAAEPDLGTALTILFSLLVILVISPIPVYYLILIIAPFISVITSFSLTAFIFYMIILMFVLYKLRLSFTTISFSAIFNIFIFFIMPIIWKGLKIYQQNRILSFFDPTRDPFGAGYQIIQSRIAIGSGKLFGKGFLMGTQKNLNFLPEHHTDFIFSVIGEEFGFFGCLIILGLFFLFLKRILMDIVKLKRVEMKYTAVGIFSFLTFQIFVNIGMNMGIVPTTGIPLPFISYGGSSLLVNVLSVGIILKYVNEQSIFV